jgi:two-component system response regulator FixJ
MGRTMPTERFIYVVDDDAGVRRSLERLLDAAGFRAISYETPAAFLNAAPSLSAGCILLDMRMPDMDGLRLQARLIELGISLPVILMTGQGNVQGAVRAMKAGAVDFIEKPFSEDVLFNAIEAAFARPNRSDRMQEAEDAAKRIARLSRREREVLDALVEGRPNKIIAFDLGLSVRTIEVHRARMMDRLGVSQLAEAVRLAVMAQMLTGAPKGPDKG